jgi:hypothetical protein
VVVAAAVDETALISVARRERAENHREGDSMVRVVDI